MEKGSRRLEPLWNAGGFAEEEQKNSQAEVDSFTYFFVLLYNFHARRPALPVANLSVALAPLPSSESR